MLSIEEQQKIDKTYVQNLAHKIENLFNVLKMTRVGYRVLETSRCIRSTPYAHNDLAEPFTKRWGSNLWIIAEKQIGFSIDKVYIQPSWCREEIWL